jgi:hypothetical protein
VWWDADPLREIEDANWISKWDWNTSTLTRLLTADGAASNNGTKQNAVLTGDILGDWREEVIFRAADNLSLRIYSTTIPAANRMFTLMHDPQYRTAIAWQNVGYNQPPHPSFFVGEGMADWVFPNVWALDTGAPAFLKLQASKEVLWPAHGQLVAVEIDAELVDLRDHWPFARIVGVTTNEPHEDSDVQVANETTVYLRATRDPAGTGRVYTIEVEGYDRSGNTVRDFVDVTVPTDIP